MEVKAKYVGNGRYVLIDLETGEVVDDAQGYGYKKVQLKPTRRGHISRNHQQRKSG